MHVLSLTELEVIAADPHICNPARHARALQQIEKAIQWRKDEIERQKVYLAKLESLLEQMLQGCGTVS